MKLIDYIVNYLVLDDEEDEIQRPQKKIKWSEVMKVAIVLFCFLLCIYKLKTNPLQVFQGEEPGTHSLRLEAGCLPAVWLMLFATLAHSAFPLVFRWEKVYQKLLWEGSLFLLFFICMPQTLVKQTAMAVNIFCREFGKEPSVFHFMSELYDYNSWYLEAMCMMLLTELILFGLYFWAEKRKGATV